MEILNTEMVSSYAAEVWMMLGFFPILFIGIILCLYGLFEEQKNGFIIGAIVVITGILMIVKGGSMPKITTYDVILTDKTYYELIEDYDVVSTEGRILTIKEKN